MSNTPPEAADTRLCGYCWIWLMPAAAIQVPMPHFLDRDIKITPPGLQVGA